MKITKARLKQIIKEELEKALQDSARANLFSEGQGATGRRRIDHKKEVAKKQKILKAVAQSQAEIRKQGLKDLKMKPPYELSKTDIEGEDTYSQLVNDIYNSYGISVFTRSGRYPTYGEPGNVYIVTNNNEELVYNNNKEFINDPMVRKLNIDLKHLTSDIAGVRRRQLKPPYDPAYLK